MTNHKDADLSVATDGPPATPGSVPQPLVTLCGNGSCPTVYITDHDTVLVQGTAATGMTVQDDELVVEVPQELLLEAARRILEQNA